MVLPFPVLHGWNPFPDGQSVKTACPVCPPVRNRQCRDKAHGLSSPAPPQSPQRSCSPTLSASPQGRSNLRNSRRFRNPSSCTFRYGGRNTRCTKPCGRHTRGSGNSGPPSISREGNSGTRPARCWFSSESRPCLSSRTAFPFQGHGIPFGQAVYLFGSGSHQPLFHKGIYFRSRIAQVLPILGV